MKNADMPAMPLQECGPDGLPQGSACYGLTKREMFAMAAMQAIITKGDHLDGKITAVYAVRYADELLDILGK